MACDFIPTPENPSGQNTSGWCNEDATKVMHASDAELDETKRVDEIHQIGKFMADDYVMVPLIQFPTLIAWRTDRVDGPDRRRRQQLPQPDRQPVQLEGRRLERRAANGLTTRGRRRAHRRRLLYLFRRGGTR